MWCTAAGMIRRPTVAEPVCCQSPIAYLTDILTRLPTHRVTDVATLLSHLWQPTVTVG